MTKAEIEKINNGMENTEDFSAVRALLEVVGRMEGKVYGIIARRVVFLSEDHGHIEYHDAWVWAD